MPNPTPINPEIDISLHDHVVRLRAPIFIMEAPWSQTPTMMFKVPSLTIPVHSDNPSAKAGYNPLTTTPKFFSCFTNQLQNYSLENYRFTCYNASSICKYINKYGLIAYLSAEKPDFVLINETWMNSSITFHSSYNSLHSSHSRGYSWHSNCLKSNVDFIITHDINRTFDDNEHSSGSSDHLSLQENDAWTLQTKKT